MQESFMLTHVVSPSMDMKTWEIVTDSEPLLQCSSLPLFDVELLPGKEIGLLYCVPTDSTAFVSPLFDKTGGNGDGGPFKLHVFSVTTGSWTLESFKLVGAVKPDKLRDHLRSVSLFTLDENLYLGTVHRSVKAKMLVFLIPLCLEK
ncbi:hypothetical protein ADEAN_000302300 [Angomonas deanei]|uniref:Uncharacterized protein n=1 Tax=Angomonas deanei TaxID=59799 RepID=A0A7G2C6W9_9TRYP|nr:hypothetical protein ADEAN_000302300 [Angomonas deanei]